VHFICGTEEVSQSRNLPQERCGLPVDVLFEHLAGIFGEKQERRGPAGQIESVSRFSFLEGGEVGNYVFSQVGGMPGSGLASRN
jgi:hypothetical protein